MDVIRALAGKREARAALAVWAVIPTLFLFFAITLAVDPSAHLGQVRLGAVVLDAPVQTPNGPRTLGGELSGALHEKLGLEVVAFASETDLRAAVLDRSVAAGIVVPAGTTAAAQAGTPVRLTVVRTDANDPFTNAFTTQLVSQLTAAANAMVPALAGGAPATEPPIAVVPDTVAAAPDYRFATIPASLVLPTWIASLAFALLVTRAAAPAREATSAARSGVAELALGVAGAALTSAVLTVAVALFALRTDFDLAALFGVLWLGLTAIAWLLQGTIRLAGPVPGALLGVLALFVQQPVSGATYPAAFAPDVVRWAEPIAPFRYVLEGVRDALVGGTTLPAMAGALALLAAAGLVLFATGVVVSNARERRSPLGRTVMAG